jgi:predicted metal-dependent hydrolase/ADP-ribose pyrophosphatase YjhB (NUDIX family)
VDAELRRGLQQMRSGQYFEAHESFEDAWRASEPDEKDFFQGLVHVTVAWYQARRGNRTGCERQLAKAQRRLAGFVPEHRGVDVALLLSSVDDAARTVADGSLDLFPPLLSATTLDDRPIAREKPHGCSVVVWRLHQTRREYLILHRGAAGGPDYEGDWAWTPPSGARLPGEPPDEAARRELREETGLEIPITPTDLGREQWALYIAEASLDAEIALDAEHDRYRWVPPDEAERVCLPATVGSSIRAVEAWLSSESA